MSTHAYTEDQIVEQPAIGLFAELGWHVALPHPLPIPLPEVEGVWIDETGLFGRETKGETVLMSRLRNSLTKLNTTIPPETINAAVDELARDRSAMSLEAANREIYLLLKEGIPVSIPDREHGGQKPERLRVIDWEHPEKNVGVYAVTY